MINVAYQSLLPSLWSTSSWSSEKPCNNCRPERHLASLLSLQFQAQNDTRRAAAGPGPCALVRGWLTWQCGTMSWFPAANSLLEFLCLIIQKARSLESWKNLISNPHYHYQKNCSWFIKEKKLSQSCRPSKKLTVIIHYTASHVHVVCSGVLPFLKWRRPASPFWQNFEGRSQGGVFFHNNSLLG